MTASGDHHDATSISIPVDVLRAAGVAIHEQLIAGADGPVRVYLEHRDDMLAEFAGVLTSVYRPGDLASLREEWD